MPLAHTLIISFFGNILWGIEKAIKKKKLITFSFFYKKFPKIVIRNMLVLN